MTMVESKPTPSITFSVPSLAVSRSSSDEREVHDHQPLGGAAGQLSPHPLPRPPRCLTPYPDASRFPHSLEPSPLSSPAFSAYSMSDAGDESETESDAEPPAKMAQAKPISSPTGAPKTDNARLLAPALHMSHLNSPTDIKFREMPLSPMRRMRAGSTTPSPPASPTQLSDESQGEKTKKKPGPIQLSLKRITTRIPSGPDRKGSASDMMGVGKVDLRVVSKQESTSAESMAVPKTTRRASEEAEQGRGGVKDFQELQVHVETVD